MGLYEKIKYLSDSKKISIRQLEEKLNYGNGTIRRWETSKPSIDKVQKVADYFNVSVDYLLDRTDDLPKQPLSKQVMMRMDTDGLSENDIDEIEQEMERFFSWRIEEIKKERGEK